MKLFLFLSGLTALLAGSMAVATAGEITGKVTLKGKPIDEIPIDLGPSCGPLNPNNGKVTTRHYVVGEGGGLANVFVYLKDAKAAPATGDGPTLDQNGCMYEPYVMGVVVNQKFKIKSSDALLHNVHATPKVNKEFNFAQSVKGMVSERSFDQPEVPVRMKCDVHPWMFAYIGVVEHPFFAVTDKDGNFKISGVPDGQYTVVAYHVKTHLTKPGLSQNVKVSGSAKQDFTVELP
jgi:hypothetical protein